MASVRRGDAAQSAAGRRARSALYLDRAGVLMAGDDPIADEGETTVVVEKRPLWLRVLKWIGVAILGLVVLVAAILLGLNTRSEEHTSELQSLMRLSYAVFCLKKKTLYHIY